MFDDFGVQRLKNVNLSVKQVKFQMLVLQMVNQNSRGAGRLSEGGWNYKVKDQIDPTTAYMGMVKQDGPKLHMFPKTDNASP